MNNIRIVKDLKEANAVTHSDEFHVDEWQNPYI